MTRTLTMVICATLAALGWVGEAQAVLDWVGHTYHRPVDGSIEPTSQVWINVESTHAGAATYARVVYSTNGGVTWASADMSRNGRMGVHDWWHVNLGTFPAGTMVRYACEVRDASGASLWDSNDGTDYKLTVNGGANWHWIGHVRHTPPNSKINSGEDVHVFIETYPIGTATQARATISRDGGWNFDSVAMWHVGTEGQNDLWEGNLGSFWPGSTNFYAVEVTFDGAGGSEWDNNGGVNHLLVANVPYSGQGVGATRHVPEDGDIDAGEALAVTVESRPQGKSVGARVLYSVNDGATWAEAALGWSGPSGSNDVWSGTIGGFPADTIVRYAMEVDFGYGGTTWDNNGGADFRAVVNPAGPAPRWIGNAATFPVAGSLDPGEDLWINVATRPLGDAVSVRVVWSTNNGAAWTSTPMSSNGGDGDKNLWHVNLGGFPVGTTNRFAMEATFTGGAIIWDNAEGTDHWIVVNSPHHMTAVRESHAWPAYGEIDPGETVWINTETEPEGAATNVQVIYTVDGGDTWNWATMTTNGAQAGRSLWHANIGAFPAGTVIRFAVRAVDAYGAERWDNNRGEDYATRVNSLIRDLYTDKARYNPGEVAQIHADLVNTSGAAFNGTARFRVTHLFGTVAELVTNVTIAAGSGKTVTVPWTARADDFRGYGVDLDLLEGGNTNDRRSSALDVSSDWTRFPRYGFFSDFYEGETLSDSHAKARELSKYHISAVQFYDWMSEHDRLIRYGDDGRVVDLYEQFDGRVQSLKTVSNKVAAAKSRNMFTMAYDLLYGDSGTGTEPEHVAWAAFTKPWSTLPIDIKQHQLVGYSPPRAIWVMDCSNPYWKKWINNQFLDAMLKLGFEGVHLDNLGGSWNYRYNSNQGIAEWDEFPKFISDCRNALKTVNPDARVIHNDVAANYLDTIAPSDEDVYYCEVWGNESYMDIRRLIERARDRANGKQVVLAAYMNLFDYTNTLSEASVRLMDAAVFANGAYHLELGEGVEMLSNHYFPMHWPPMTPTLRRAMRDYYDFIVRYQNLLFFNTLGNVEDGTSGANLSSPTDPLGKDAAPGTIWTVVKLCRDEFDTISLVNLNGVDSSWRNRSARPTERTDVQLKYYVDKEVQHVHVATPDDALGRAVELPFTQGLDGGGRYIEFTVPRLEYWDLVIIDKRTDVKVDGWPGDWSGTTPSQLHSVTIDQGEWIYRGEAGDARTFAGASPNEDITEVRLTCDEDYAYFLVRFSDITDAALPAVGIAWNSHLAGRTMPWIGDASTPSASIALETGDQYATRQIMVYTAGGAPRVRLYNDNGWYVPNAMDSAASVSAENDCMEFRINRHDLDLVFPQKITFTLASFRCSGSEAGSDATFDSVDGNNDAVDIMGGDLGVSANAWARDLSDNQIARHYPVVLNQQGADASLRVAWPSFDGQAIDVRPGEAYTVVAQFTETLPTSPAAFTFAVNGVTQAPSGAFIQDELAGDFMNEARFPWSDAGSGVRTIGVYYAASGFQLAAQRVITLNYDTDADGLPNNWEMNSGLNPRDAVGPNGRLGDPDADGVSNEAEWLAGTDPLKKWSFLHVDMYRSVSGMPRELVWDGVSGRTYRVYSAPSPAGPFVPVSADLQVGASNAPMNFIDTATDSARVYRLHVVTGPE